MKKILAFSTFLLTFPFISLADDYKSLEEPSISGVQLTRINHSHYCFNNFPDEDLDAFISSDSTGTAAGFGNSKEGIRNLTTTDEFNAGKIFISGNGIFNKEETRKDLKQAANIVDLKGEIGKVLIFNGKDATLNKVLGLNLNSLQNEISTISQLFFVLNFNEISNYGESIGTDKKTLFARIEFNFYSQDKTSGRVSPHTVVIDETATTYGPTTTDYTEVKRQDFQDNYGKWDLGKWMVYEFPFGQVKNMASAMRMQIPAEVWNNSSLLIRNVELFYSNKDLNKEDVDSVSKRITNYKVCATSIKVDEEQSEGKRQLKATVYPTVVKQDVIWEVTEGSKFIEIDNAGNLNVKHPGKAKVRVSSVVSPEISEEIEIILEGDEITEIAEIGHSQNGSEKFELTAGDTDKVTIKIATENNNACDPTVLKFESTQDYCTLGELEFGVHDGKYDYYYLPVSIKKGTQQGSFKINVSVEGKELTNSIEVLHYEAPKGVSIMEYWGENGYWVSHGNQAIQFGKEENKVMTITPFIHETDEFDTSNYPEQNEWPSGSEESYMLYNEDGESLSTAYQGFDWELFQWDPVEFGRPTERIKAKEEYSDDGIKSASFEGMIKVKEVISENGTKKLEISPSEGYIFKESEEAPRLRIYPLTAAKAKGMTTGVKKLSIMSRGGDEDVESEEQDGDNDPLYHDYYIMTMANQGSLSGITDITEAMENAEAVYYNLQGVCVGASKLTPGFYIRRAGNDVKKVFVK